MKKFFASIIAWGNRNAASIYTGCVVALVMMSIVLVKDIKHATKEVGFMVNEIELIKENSELTRATIDQFGVINDLLKTSGQQHDQIEQAVETIDAQAIILQKLVDYLKEIGHWPPKIDPPKPVNPDKWI